MRHFVEDQNSESRKHSFSPMTISWRINWRSTPVLLGLILHDRAILCRSYHGILFVLGILFADRKYILVVCTHSVFKPMLSWR